MNRPEAFAGLDRTLHDAKRRSLIIAGIAVIALIMGLVFLLAIRIDVGAIRISGQVIPEGDLDRVDHRDGGTITSVHVQEGDTVKAGEILIRLDPVDLRRSVEDLQLHHASTVLELARVEAEAENRTTLNLPTTPLLSEPDRWNRLVEAHQHALLGALSAQESSERVLRSRIAEIAAAENALSLEASALNAERIAALQTLSMRRALVGNGHASRAELLELEQSFAALEARIAAQQRRIDEADAQLRTAEDTLTETIAARRNLLAQDRLTLMGEESRLARDLAATTAALDRTVITAPTSGTVATLPSDRPGMDVSPGAMVVEIVAEHAPMIVEARLPVDVIDQIGAGLPARIRPGSAAMLGADPLAATVTTINPDRHLSEDGSPYYRVVLEVSEDGGGQDELFIGMAVEVFVVTDRRTLAEQLLQPIREILDNAWRQA